MAVGATQGSLGVSRAMPLASEEGKAAVVQTLPDDFMCELINGLPTSP